jgi:hypothetical protein
MSETKYSVEREAEHQIGVMLFVKAKNPAEAYAKLHAFFGAQKDSGVEWESTDEWFDHEGEPLTKEQITEARDAFFKK